MKAIDLLKTKEFYGSGIFDDPKKVTENEITELMEEYAELRLSDVSNSLIDKKFMDWLAKEAPEVNESLWNCIHKYETNDY